MKISIGCRNFKLGRDWSLCLLSALNAAPHVLATNLFNLLTIKQHWVSLLTLPFHSQTLVPLDTSLQAVVFQNAVFPLFSAVLIRAWSCLLRPYKEARLYYLLLGDHFVIILWNTNTYRTKKHIVQAIMIISRQFYNVQRNELSLSPQPDWLKDDFK